MTVYQFQLIDLFDAARDACDENDDLIELLNGLAHGLPNLTDDDFETLGDTADADRLCEIREFCDRVLAKTAGKAGA